MFNSFFTYYPEDDELRRCSICGASGPLTFEHLPMRQCFNESAIALRTIRELIRNYKGLKEFRRGMGRLSLCDSCNNRTAKWYGAQFAIWTQRAMELRDRIHSRRVAIPFTIAPLQVAKQIATMCLAMTWEYTHSVPHYQRLRQLVLNPYRNGWPDKLRFYTYVVGPHSARLSGFGVPATLSTNTKFCLVECEIASPSGLRCHARW